MQWIGERFFTVNGRWFDAADAAEVDVWCGDISVRDAAGWTDRCGELARLRHPLLNPLIDWGPAGGTRVFEAYATSTQARARGVAAESALDHVARFLRGSGVSLDRARSRRAVRPLSAGTDGWIRPVGLRLQTRPALEAIEESLDAGLGAGAVIVTISAPHPGRGLKTLQTLAARSARLRGYLPLAPETLIRFPDIISTIRERHLCLLLGPGSTRQSVAVASTLLTELASGASRGHLVLRFVLGPHSRTAVSLGPMPTRALIGMVYADDEHGPGEGELFAAARVADGNPGAFVDALSRGFQHVARPMVVHESPAEYIVSGEPERGSAATPRVLGSALRAVSRASSLVRAGRHASGSRILERACRVLEARGHREGAASCAWHLGALALDRGRPDVARQRFAQGRVLGGQEASGLACLVGEGVALTEMDQLVEAEALLRGAVASLELSASIGPTVIAAAALARCLYWQERYSEAIAVATTLRETDAEPGARVRLLAILSRAEARLRRAAPAVASARAAVTLGSTVQDPAAQASAHLALAQSLAVAGDCIGAATAVATALSIAQVAHLPLFRARAMLIRGEWLQGETAPRDLRALDRLHLPPLLARRRAAMRAAAGEKRSEPVHEVESLLDLSQRSGDDRSALGAICHAVAERLRTSSLAIVANGDRVLQQHGRNLATLPAMVRETLASGSRTSPESLREPREAAEPVRYGGEVVAAIVCRWPAGVTLDVEDTKIVLRAAALSAASPVRALLDMPVPQAPSVWSDLIGTSPAAASLREAVTRAARAPFPVLIEGESGSGKELVARAIHRLGPRRDRRFCALNCAALTEDLLEAELFGHTRGAFTGAAAERAGIFEEADGGTVFLDEVGELSARAQAKLLRVLQDGEVRRVGENLPRRVDVRIVAATNRTLEQEVGAGRFRADLRFRLDVVRIPVPPLRDRVSDIPLLATHFWRDASQRVSSQATLSGEVLAALSRYDWPGNVRELQNVIAWIAVHSPRRGRVGVLGLPEHIARSRTTPAATLDAAREEFERRFIRAALATAQGRRSKAADALGISRQGLAKMMRRLRIESP